MSSAKLALLGLISTVTAFAANADCMPDRCENVRITRLVTTPDRIWVRTSGTLTNLNCTLDPGVYVALLRSNYGFKEIYANLLALQLAGMTISFRVDEGSSPCSIAYVYSDTP